MSARRHSLGVVIITKNEAKNLRASLPPLQNWADEIVVLDSGSADNTQAVVEQHGGRFYSNTDWQGFGIQRQRAQKLATADWILALDADEQINDDLKVSIDEAIQNGDSNIVYGIRILTHFCGHLVDNPNWFLPVKAYRRLYCKRRYQFRSNRVHESLDCNKANKVILNGYLIHQESQSPEFYLRKRLEYAKTWAEERHRQGGKIGIGTLIGHSLWTFFRSYLIEGRFLKGKYALIYCMLYAQYTFNKYAILYNLGKKDFSSSTR